MCIIFLFLNVDRFVFWWNICMNMTKMEIGEWQPNISNIFRSNEKKNIENDDETWFKRSIKDIVLENIWIEFNFSGSGSLKRIEEDDLQPTEKESPAVTSHSGKSATPSGKSAKGGEDDIAAFDDDDIFALDEVSCTVLTEVESESGGDLSGPPETVLELTKVNKRDGVWSEWRIPSKHREKISDTVGETLSRILHSYPIHNVRSGKTDGDQFSAYDGCYGSENVCWDPRLKPKVKFCLFLLCQLTQKLSLPLSYRVGRRGVHWCTAKCWPVVASAGMEIYEL